MILSCRPRCSDRGRWRFTFRTTGAGNVQILFWVTAVALLGRLRNGLAFAGP
jgi:hypothetical protein